jgi:hypothetical protein
MILKKKLKNIKLQEFKLSNCKQAVLPLQTSPKGAA